MPARSRTSLLRRIAALAGALALLVPQSALAGAITPPGPASSAAEDTRVAYLVMLVLATLIALVAIVGLLAAVRRGRAVEVPERRTRGTTGVQGRVGIALGVLALATFVFGIVVTESTRDADAASADEEELQIRATGNQWLWRYEYPGGTFSYHELVVPVDTTVVLEVDSIDVLHRWWVPALGPMVDATPGDAARVVFRPDEVGNYEGRSTRFSGPAFATMRTRVRVVPQEEYDAWLEQQSSDIIEAQNAVQQEVEEQVPSADQPGEEDAPSRDLEPGPAGEGEAAE